MSGPASSDGRGVGRAGGRADRGSGSVLVVGATAAVLVLLTVLVVLGSALVAGARARTAADLSALGGAGLLMEGAPDAAACAEAADVAAANGGALLACRSGRGDEGGPELTVLVAVEPTLPAVPTPTARARAGAVPDEG